MQETIDILASPLDTVERIAKQPESWKTYSICASVFFLITWMDGCWQNLADALKWSNILGPILFAPIVVCLVSLGTTILIYFLIHTLRDHDARPGSFKTVYALNLHCGAIFLLGEVVNFLLVRTNILGDNTTPLRGRFPLGLDMLLLGVDDPNLYLSIILHSTSVFLIWYLVVLSMGIRLVSGITKHRATIIVIVYWGTLVLMALGAAHAAGGDTVIRVRL
jgi:hypothetical protein